jgi:flagellar biosynthesis GTPase FlhF
MTNQPAHRIKSYFAASVDTAIAQAREELGAEALLLNTRKLVGDGGQPAGYEVVFGLPGEVDRAEVPVREFRGLLSDPRYEDRQEFQAVLHEPRQAPRAELRGDVRNETRNDIRNDVRVEAPVQVRSEPAQSRSEVVATQVRSEVSTQVRGYEATQVRNAARLKAAETRSSAAELAATRSSAAELEPRPQSEDVAGELEKLHAQIDEIRSLIVKSSAPQITIGRTVPELADVYSRLMSSGVDAAISKDIVDRLEASMATDAFFMRGGERSSDGSRSHGSRTDGERSVANRWKALRFDAGRLEAFVRSELECRVAIEPTLGAGGEHGSAVVMVGPTGAGKTTSIMKLAASDLVTGRKVRILSLDPSRPGQNHLQSFSSNLGIAYAVVQSVHALPAMVARGDKQDLVFIDTPGYSSTGDRSAELAALVIEKIQNVEVHLVAPGYMKGTDLRRCIQRYEVFHPSRMLVTKLDETDAFGSVFSEAARAGLALSFLANGTAIPKDIRRATTEDLMSLAFERKVARAQCA